ncbi:MAG: hypothetical protein Q7R95_01480 [bacterium]|nr:hypothetical protein [bacterium]
MKLESKQIYHVLMIGALVALFSITTQAHECSGGGIPPAALGGIESLQQKVNAAKDGEVIDVTPGLYSGPAALPLGLGDGIAVSQSRGGAATCFLRIENKNITLKGIGGDKVIMCH